MGNATRRRWALVPIALAFASWFGHKVFDHLLDDVLGKATEPWMPYIYEYAIPIVLALVCVWILWPDRFRTEKPEQAASTPSVATRTPEFVSMAEASRQAYEEARRVKSYWAESAEVAAKDYSGRADQTREDKVLCVIANLIAGKIPIYGEASPSTVREPIEKAKDSTGCHFSDGGNTLRFMLFNKTVYRNIAVRADALSRLVATLDSRLKTTTLI